jgi:hypothetical protein
MYIKHGILQKNRWHTIFSPVLGNATGIALHSNGVAYHMTYWFKDKLMCRVVLLSPTRREPVAAPHCPPQIPHTLICDWSQASTVKSRRLTAGTMARPDHFAVCFTAICAVKPIYIGTARFFPHPGCRKVSIIQVPAVWSLGTMWVFR